jgi:hypothetical protein
MFYLSKHSPAFAAAAGALALLGAAQNAKSADASCGFNIVGYGDSFDRTHKDWAFQRDGNDTSKIKVWAYTKVDAIRGPRQSYSTVRGTNFLTVKITGPANATCVGSLSFDVRYEGTIDRFTTGVGPLGGAVTQYWAKIKAGLIGEQNADWNQGVYHVVWAKESNPLAEFTETVGNTIVSALLPDEVQVGVQLLDQVSEQSSCDEAVSRKQRLTIENYPFVAGHSYRVFLNLEARTKGVAAGVAGGFAEIDFFGKDPKLCDKNSYKNKGLTLYRDTLGIQF